MRRSAPLLLLLIACGPTQPGTTADTSATGSSEAGSSMGPTTAPTTSGAPDLTTTTASTSTSATSTGVSASEATISTGSTGDSSTGDSSTGDSSTGEVLPGHCAGGEPLFQLPELRVDDGMERCPDGQVHRFEAAQCLHHLEIKECPADECGGPCDQLGDGVCNELFVDSCFCHYPCTSDADCLPGAACLCAAGIPSGGGGYEGLVAISECVPANCRTDADCGEFLCALSPSLCGYGFNDGLFCHTADDECVDGQDCVDQQLGNLCVFEAAEQRWVCTEAAMCE